MKTTLNNLVLQAEITAEGEPKHAESKNDSLVVVDSRNEVATKVNETTGDFQKIRASGKSNEKNSCTVYEFEESPADEVDLHEVFIRAFGRLQQIPRSQIFIQVAFLHPSTRTDAFQEKIGRFLESSGADEICRKSFSHGRAIAQTTKLAEQKLSGFTVENYYFF